MLQTIWFGLVYGGCDWITSQRSILVRVHFAFEESIPFVPDMVWVYSSVYVLMLLTPFVVDSAERLKHLAFALALATGIAGVFFLLIPAERDFPIQEGRVGLVPELFRFSDWVNLDFNQVPSLHVAFALIYAESFVRNANGAAKIVVMTVLRTWPIAIGIAAVLTFQHHLVDVVTGYLLGVFSWRTSQSRWLTDHLAGSRTNR